MSTASSASITNNKLLAKSNWFSVFVPLVVISALAFGLLNLAFYLSFQTVSSQLERDIEERLLQSASRMAQQISDNYVLQQNLALASTQIQLQEIMPSLRRMSVPWAGSSLLMDSQGKLYSLPNELDKTPAGAIAEFKQQVNLQPLRTEASGLISLKLQGEDSLLSWASISGTNWKMLNLVKAKNSLGIKQQLAHDYLQLVVLLALFIACMFALLMFFLKRRDAKISFNAQAIPAQDATQIPTDANPLADFFSLVEGPLMVCQFNAQQQLIGCNSAFERLIGNTLNNLKGQSYLQLLGLNNLAAKPEIQEAQTRPEIEIFPEQQPSLHCWYSLHLDAAGAGFLFLLDMSAAKEKLAAFEGEKQRGRLAAKMRAEFFQVAVNDAHKLLLELLHNARGLDADLTDYCQSKLLELQYLLDNLQDMAAADLEVAPDAESSSSVLDMQAFLQECISASKPLLTSQERQLILNSHPELPAFLNIDRSRLFRLVRHLLRQMIQLSGTSNVHLEINYQTEQSCLKIQIYDLGGGINIEERLQRFKLNTPLSADYTKAHSSLGLGQLLSRQLVNELKGELHVEATANQGLLVQLSLPATPVLPEPNANIKSRVLVVDDGPVNTLLASSILEKSGYQVDIATSGKQALELGAQQIYDLVLMDIFMPEMDGLETSRRWRNLKNLNAQVPILALTANAADINQQELTNFGINAYLTKPYKPNELRQLVAAWIEHKLTT